MVKVIRVKELSFNMVLRVIIIIITNMLNIITIIIIMDVILFII